jgi:uncharacterized protein (DUF58 family)
MLIDTLQSSRHVAALRRMEWRVRHAVETALSGDYRSTFRGRGMEFDQVVKYEFGDDVRDIDWNVTARLGEPYRKKFIEEREVTILLLLEDTPSLLFGSGARSKRAALLELAALVALLGAVNRDRVGLLHATPTGYQFQEPVRGRGQILHAAARLLGRPEPDVADGATAQIPWPLVARAVPRHSVLLWLSDFAPRPVPEGWAVVQRRYQPFCLRVDDPWERELPAVPAFGAYDPLAGRVLVVDPSSRAQREAHARWRQSRDETLHALQPDALARLVVTPAEDLLDALVAFFRARQSAGRR